MTNQPVGMVPGWQPQDQALIDSPAISADNYREGSSLITSHMAYNSAQWLLFPSSFSIHIVSVVGWKAMALHFGGFPQLEPSMYHESSGIGALPS